MSEQSTRLQDLRRADYKDASWKDKLIMNIFAKGEGVGNSIAGFFGFDDAFGTEMQQDLAALKFKPSDISSTDIEAGLNISGAEGGPERGGEMAAQSPAGNTSLGRFLALEEEPALKDTNYNKNNFNV